MSQFLAVLGRQSDLGLAELESVFGGVRKVGEKLAVVEADSVDIS